MWVGKWGFVGVGVRGRGRGVEGVCVCACVRSMRDLLLLTYPLDCCMVVLEVVWYVYVCVCATSPCRWVQVGVNLEGGCICV